MKIDFSRGAWNTGEITYAYSYRFEETPEFVQLDDCVINRKISEERYGYDNISVLTRKAYKPGARIATRCAFKGEGAPLITIAEKMYTDPRGVQRYGDYYEVVLYHNGVNVWRMVMKDGKVTWKKLMGAEFPVAAGEAHTLSVEIGAERLTIEADGHKMSVLAENMYSTFHLGVDACEGYCRFYDMTIDGETAGQE